MFCWLLLSAVLLVECALALASEQLTVTFRNNSLVGHNAGQYTQLVLPADGLPLLFFHQAGGPGVGDNLLLVRDCADAQCSRGAVRRLDGARAPGEACGRFLKVVRGARGPAMCYACGAYTLLGECSDARCRGAFSRRVVARSALDGGHASYCDVLAASNSSNSTDTVVVLHQFSAARNTSALLAVHCAATRCGTGVVVDASAEAGTYPFLAAPAHGGLIATYFGGGRQLRFARLAPGSSTWSSPVIVDSRSTYRYDALALDRSTDLPVVLYVDERSGDVWIAECVRWPCDDAALFSRSLVDNIGTVEPNEPFPVYGVFPSAHAFDGFNHGRPVFSYYNASSETSGALKISQCQPNLHMACHSFDVTVVDSAPLGGFGRDSDFAIDESNKRWFASFLNYGNSDSNMTVGFLGGDYF